MSLGARIAVLALLFVCAGCDDDVVGAPVTRPVAGGQQVEQVVGPSGGSLALTTGEGARFTLTLPAGALDSSTTLRVETAPVTGTQRFHLRFFPAGLLLAGGARATLRIELPASIPLPANLALGYDGAPLPFTRATDGALEVELSYFAAASSASVAGAALRETAATAASASGACSDVPSLGDFAVGGLTDAELAAPADYGRCVLGAVETLADSGRFDEAMQLANTTAAYLQSVGDDSGNPFIAQAEALACQRLRGALDAAVATTVTTTGQLHTIVRPILYWEMAVQLLGADCPQVGVNEYLTVIAVKSEQAAGAYDALQESLGSTEGPAYAAALAEVREQEATVREAQALRTASALLNATRQGMEQVAQPALLRSMLQAPWQRCRETGQYDRLIELMRLTDGPPAVKYAANTCGVQIMAWSLEATGSTETGRLSFPLGGVDARTDRRDGTLAVRADGRLRLLGPIRALQCPAGSPAGSERIELRINGQLVTALSGSVVADPEVTLDMPTLLSVAGIAPVDFTSATLTVVRSGDACAGFWGPLPQTLATITLLGLSEVVTTQFEGSGTGSAGCGGSSATWSSGVTVFLTRLPDGTHRLVVRHPLAESVTGFTDVVRIADRYDPEIEGVFFDFTPINVAGGSETTYTANWTGKSFSRSA